MGVVVGASRGEGKDEMGGELGGGGEWGGAERRRGDRRRWMGEARVEGD